jgi:hypothetical protein
LFMAHWYWLTTLQTQTMILHFLKSDFVVDLRLFMALDCWMARTHCRWTQCIMCSMVFSERFHHRHLSQYDSW